MDKMTYKEAYLEALEVTQMIFNLYKELTMYKIKGGLLGEENNQKVNNLIDLLNEVLNKEDAIYDKINRSFDLHEIGELLDYVEDVGEVRPFAVDFEKLPYLNSWLIPRRIFNRVNDLFRHNEENANVAVVGEDGGVSSLDYEDDQNSRNLVMETGVSLEQFRKEYIQTIMLEDAFMEDYTRFFLAGIEAWLERKSPVNLEQAKFYQEMATAQMMMMFTDYVDERLMLSKKFDFSEVAFCRAPILADSFRYVANKKDIIKSSTTIYELKCMLEDFITVEEMDVSDLRNPVAKLNRMYFEAGLKTLTEKEFNDVLTTYNDLLETISKDSMMYYSLDSVDVVRTILNRVSKKNFKFDITKGSEGKEKVKRNKKKAETKVKVKSKLSGF